ncbi:VOC family protein [Thalassospira lucentensis]|uniref:VOC family protein n=1 Tax=Thalassospira lucentensis TaxID=168935 RepID=UPI0003B6C1FD|nr:VOC family protein [Thalassospira lucentensis]RCK19974.1 glyoxalase [Thalassospira lucentensis MCCC 1A00383 = DSM 14000]
MAVKRIVSNFAVTDIAKAKAFYEDILGLSTVMDHGWIRTFAAAGETMTTQVNFATEGGSGTPVPDMSIEVDDLEETLGRMTAAGIEIEYGPVDEPWGVRRFYVRDPFGKLVNILEHK